MAGRPVHRLNGETQHNKKSAKVFGAFYVHCFKCIVITDIDYDDGDAWVECAGGIPCVNHQTGYFQRGEKASADTDIFLACMRLQLWTISRVPMRKWLQMCKSDGILL